MWLGSRNSFCIYSKITYQIAISSFKSTTKNLKSSKLTLEFHKEVFLGQFCSTYMSEQFHLMEEVTTSCMRTTMLRHTKVVNLPNTIDKMQQEMNEINAWLDDKNLYLNAKKTKLILFSISQMPRRHNLQNAMVDIYNKEQPMKWNLWCQGSTNTWPGEFTSMRPHKVSIQYWSLYESSGDL